MSRLPMNAKSTSSIGVDVVAEDPDVHVRAREREAVVGHALGGDEAAVARRHLLIARDVGPFTFTIEAASFVGRHALGPHPREVVLEHLLVVLEEVVADAGDGRIVPEALDPRDCAFGSLSRTGSQSMTPRRMPSER